MGKKEKRDRSRSKDRKRKKHKSSRSSSTSSSDTSIIKHNKKHKKDKKKKNKSKDNNLPSIDDIIAQKLQEKRGAGGQNTNSKVEVEVEKKSSMKPMTKAEYDQKQSVVRRVYDEDTGRTRLVKG